MKEIANSCIWGPTMQAVLDKWGVSANRPKLDQFCFLRTFSCTKSKFKGGIFYEKNWHLMLLGPFWSNAWLPTGQIWADQIFFGHFEFKMPNKFGSFLCKKLIRAKMGMVSFGHRPKIFYKIF